MIRVRTARLVAAAALFGGIVGAVLIAAIDGINPATKTTTVIQKSIVGHGRAALDARAIYSASAGGVADITAKDDTVSTGTGIVLDREGHILTAAHVVNGSRSISVKLAGGESRAAQVLGKDNATDIAVLKIDPDGLKLQPLQLGDSSKLVTGDAVAAVGDPFDFERSISTGIVSGLDRTIEAPNGFTVAHAIQVDAALNPGNSGGPVLDADGHVVGVVDQIATSGNVEQNSGVGFAIPSDLVRSELARLKAGQAVKHAYLGVTTTASSTGEGATLDAVQSGGPAAKAGLKAGDVVTRFDGRTIKGSNDLIAVIAELQPGAQVDVTVKRGGRTESFTVTLAQQPAQRTTTTTPAPSPIP